MEQIMNRIDRNARPTADTASDKIKRRRAYDPKAPTPAYIVVIRALVLLAAIVAVAEFIR